MPPKVKREKVAISPRTWTDEAGETWIVMGEGPIIDKAVEVYLATFDDGEAHEHPIHGWCIRSDSLERHGYHHLRIAVFVERV